MAQRRSSTPTSSYRHRCATRFGIAHDRIARLESQLRKHFPEAWVEGFGALIPKMTNDVGDRHVLAAAAHAKAHTLVTYNLKHFPAKSTVSWRVTAMGPGQFLRGLYASDPQSVTRVLREQAADIRRTLPDLLRVLHKAVPAFVEAVCIEADITL